MKEVKTAQNKTKLGFWKTFFVIMGVIFSILLVVIGILIAYILIAKPAIVDVVPAPDVLQGVDLEEAASQITPEQEACATEKLGEERVAEIKAGSELRNSDIIKAGGCF